MRTIQYLSPAERIINFLEVDDRAEALAAEHAAEIAAIEALSADDVERELSEIGVPYEEGLAKTKRMIGIDRTELAPNRPRRLILRHSSNKNAVATIVSYKKFAVLSAVSAFVCVGFMIMLYVAQNKHFDMQEIHSNETITKIEELDKKISKIAQFVNDQGNVNALFDNRPVNANKAFFTSLFGTKVSAKLSSINNSLNCNNVSCYYNNVFTENDDQNSIIVSNVNYK